MNSESLIGQNWNSIVRRLGGAVALEKSARTTGALVRARSIANGVVLLRLLLAYCLGERGLRSAAAWATAQEIADISNPALLYRLQNSVEWLEVLVAQALAKGAPKAGKGRLIRIIDGTTVPKAGTAAKKSNGLWRIHAAFDLPSERFAVFELTDEKGGEQLDRIPALKDEIRIADRGFMQADRLAKLLSAGADVVIRTGWKNGRWLDKDAAPLDIIALLRSRKAKKQGFIDQPISVGRKGGAPLSLRLVALRKVPEAAEAARAKARRDAQKERYEISEATLVAAEWILIVTSLKADTFSTDDVLDLYRLRWRIELAFKRLKSLIGLEGPPGKDFRSAKAWILAHLLMSLLLEPLVDAFEDSPRLASAA